MLLSMRRTEEPDKKRVKIEEEYQREDYPRELPGYESILGREDNVEESILERLSGCTVTGDSSKPSKKRSFVRQYGVTEEEYVDITQVQQLLLESATTSGKAAKSKNRDCDSRGQDCQQGEGRAKSPTRTALRPHSQPSPQQRYPQRHLEYFPSTSTGKARMLAEDVVTPPHLLPPPQTGGHSPNVEELFALWFGTPTGSTGWYKCPKRHPRPPRGIPNRAAHPRDLDLTSHVMAISDHVTEF